MNKKAKTEARAFSIALIIILFAYLLVVPTAQAGIFGWLKAVITGQATKVVNVSITVGNQVPNVTFVSIIDTFNPTEEGTKAVTFIFNVTDGDGTGDINKTGSSARFQMTGQATRSNSSCLNVSQAVNTVTFNCTIYMWYFDGNGIWTVNATGKDLQNVVAENSTTTFVIGITSAFKVSPTALTWSPVAGGATNQTSIDPTTLNNTGNLVTTNVSVTGMNLRGETNTAQWILAANFSVGNSTGGGNPECDATGATALVNGSAQPITNAYLPRGNLSIGSGTGQEQLYYCLKWVDPLISQQVYDTNYTGGAWTLTIPTS